jgi:succinyl-CoA synthetase alpha subunit
MVPGTRFSELLPLFQADEDTDAVLLIGEIGGTMEEEAADSLDSGAFAKPLVAFLAGRWAPEGVRMGHAGAIISGGSGSVAHKSERLRRAGAAVAGRPGQVSGLLREMMGGI